jgi:hypothetical protein
MAEFFSPQNLVLKRDSTGKSITCRSFYNYAEVYMGFQGQKNF